MDLVDERSAGDRGDIWLASVGGVARSHPRNRANADGIGAGGFGRIGLTVLPMAGSARRATAQRCGCSGRRPRFR